MYTGRCGAGAGRHMMQIKYFALTPNFVFYGIWLLMPDCNIIIQTPWRRGGARWRTPRATMCRWSWRSSSRGWRRRAWWVVIGGDLVTWPWSSSLIGPGEHGQAAHHLGLGPGAGRQDSEGEGRRGGERGRQSQVFGWVEGLEIFSLNYWWRIPVLSLGHCTVISFKTCWAHLLCPLFT